MLSVLTFLEASPVHAGEGIKEMESSVLVKN
jgi:hypothetical protein